MTKASLVTILTSLIFGTLIGIKSNPTQSTLPAWSPPIETVTFQDVGYPSLMSPHANPILVADDYVFVVNTPADTVDIIDIKTRQVASRISVGIDPVSLAIRPDGKELWVSNHVSDSISVIDLREDSKTHFQIIATIQDFDLKTKATRFDEPVGIAFADNQKAYVALSSENKIAVIDVATRQIKRRLHIAAQDPRAIYVHNDRLYVVPFESNNQTQLSGGYEIDGELVTFNAHEHSIAHNNVLSLGHTTDIVKHPKVPDRDLFVFDTKTDRLVETIDSLGTLLYGLTVDSQGTVYVAQTDARNDVNGRSGTKGHGLKELENRAFLNQITQVKFTEHSNVGLGVVDNNEPESVVDRFELEPLPPKQPAPGRAFATPYAVQVLPGDQTVIATAAGSDKVFTVDVQTGQIISHVQVGAVPRGVAVNVAQPNQAWAFNAVDNSVSLLSLTGDGILKNEDTIRLEDPTDPVIKRGRIAFNTASASSTGTFSCASCHPDGHTDQLLWVLKTPVVTGGDQIMPRSTMPLRGLRDTAPFHWDGIPGDPYGGNNSEHIYGHVDPNCDVNDPASTTRHVIDGSLGSTMSLVNSTVVNDEGKAGHLSAQQRDDMAEFLLNIPYPPSQRRGFDNKLSEQAKRGMELFHIQGDDDPTKRAPNVCGDCHRMPFLVSTNTPGTGMDAPTWRGAYDRWLILPQGRLNIIDFDFYRRVADRGGDEKSIWQFSWAGRRRFNPVWNMVLESSTGYSGAFGRQVTLNQDSVASTLVNDLLDSLELAAIQNAVVLDLHGALAKEKNGKQVTSENLDLQFVASKSGGHYISMTNANLRFDRQELIELAERGQLVGTITGRHGENAGVAYPQPAIWTRGPIEQQRGRQEFPILHRDNQVMEVSGRHISPNATLIVDGIPVNSKIKLDENELVSIELDSLPDIGLHFIQLQNPNGMFSNDFIVHVVEDNAKAGELKSRLKAEYNPEAAFRSAIRLGDLELVSLLLKDGRKVNSRIGDGGELPLGIAATYNQIQVAELLIEKGARVSGRNRDGNTALHIAAFYCHDEFVDFLLSNKADKTKENNNSQTPLEVVSSPWSRETAGFYRYVGDAIGVDIDLEQVKEDRPKMAKKIRDYNSDVDE